MQEARTWRDLLAEIIRDPHEKQRIAAALGVNPVTPSRWANNQSRPRSQHHKKLLDAIPARHRQEFAELFAVDYPASREPVVNEQAEETVEEIPSPFYSRAFSAYTSTPHDLRITSVLTLILQQMLSHLDSEQEGISISVALCTEPPEGEMVRSLHEFAGRGTAPFDTHLEMQPFFLGVGTMAAFVVTHSQRLVIQNLREQKGFVHALRTDYEESAMVCPITFENRIAGCSIVSSTRLDFFTPVRQQIAQDYTNLMALALSYKHFYKPSQLQLRVLPDPEQQRKFFANFSQRLVATISRHSGEGITRAEAEALTLREIEEEILSQDDLFA